MTKKLHAGARTDLLAAQRRYESQRRGLGRRFRVAFHAVVGRILESPTRHPLWPDLPPEMEVRRILLARPWPYSVAYLIDGDLVVIVAVAHHRQPPGYWIDRV